MSSYYQITPTETSIHAENSASVEDGLIGSDSTSTSSKYSLTSLSSDSESYKKRTIRSYLQPGIVDLYVLRQMLWILFVGSFLMSMFIMLMDFLNCSDVFLQTCKDNNATVLFVMVGYYGPRILAIYDSLFSTFVLLAGLITVILMSRKKETIAFSCMGIRRSRAIYMVILTSILLVLFGTLVREYVFPAQRAIICGDIKSYFSKSKNQVESKTDPLTQVHISGESLDIKNQTIIKPVFEMPQSLDRYGMELRAEIAIWQAEQLGDGVSTGHAAGYLLRNVSSEQSLENQKTLYQGDTPTFITPSNNPWLKANECFLVSGLEIGDLAINSEYRNYCTISELQRIMRRMPITQRDKAALVIHSRLARPALDICVILVGLTFVLKRESNGTIIFIKSIIWCLFCWLIINMSLALGGDSTYALAPALSAWIPLIILGGILAYVWDNDFH